jgi:hypothetical protein
VLHVDPSFRNVCFFGLVRGSILMLALLLFGCAAGHEPAPSENSLQAGVWSGDVAPADGAPFGALFHVMESDAGLTIRLESQFIQQTFTGVAVTSDSLTFVWPMASPRRCLLRLGGDHNWRGSCLGDGTDPIGLLLVPPARPEMPTGLARAAYESDISWIEGQVGRLSVLVQADGNAAAHEAQLRESAVAAFNSAFALLEETPPDIPFWILYINSRADMRRLVGWPAGGWADGVARTAANTVTERGQTPDRHEIMHVAATVAWGVPASPWAWINEGLATYAPGECAGTDIHSLAAALIETDTSVSLVELINHFREIDEVSAYLQSASVVGYVRDVAGITAVRSIWKEGPSAIPKATGLDIATFEHEWRNYVSRFSAATDELEHVRTHGCLQ